MRTSNSHLVLLGILLAFAELGTVTMGRLLDVDQTGFNQNYAIEWGGDHVKFLDNGILVQLSMDKYSGNTSIWLRFLHHACMVSKRYTVR